MNFEKMVLLPESLGSQMYADVERTKSQKARLDESMKQVLARKDISQNHKWKLYQNALNGYIDFVLNLKQSPRETTFEPQDDTEDKEKLQTHPLISEIMDAVPPLYKKRAKFVLQRLVSTNIVTWDDTGVVSIRNRIVPNSNIIDLILSVVSKKKKTRGLKGLDHFERVLYQLNVPRKYLARSISPHRQRSSSYDWEL